MGLLPGSWRWWAGPGSQSRSPLHQEMLPRLSSLPTLLGGVHSRLTADKAYDASLTRTYSLQAHGIIPLKSNRKERRWYDHTSHRTRQLVASFFADIKQFRRIATRYCKLTAAIRRSSAWPLECCIPSPPGRPRGPRPTSPKPTNPPQ